MKLLIPHSRARNGTITVDSTHGGWNSGDHFTFDGYTYEFLGRCDDGWLHVRQLADYAKISVFHESRWWVRCPAPVTEPAPEAAKCDEDCCDQCGGDGTIMLSDAGPGVWGEDVFCDVDRPIPCPSCGGEGTEAAP